MAEGSAPPPKRRKIEELEKYFPVSNKGNIMKYSGRAQF